MLTTMILEISADKSIKQVQEDFSHLFPYLKIEFFRNGTIARKDRYPAATLISNDHPISAAQTRPKNNGDLYLEETMTVAELEQSFLTHFGLSVQVFRRSGKLWLETTMTDNWTLKQQNDHGREIAASW